MIRYLKFSVFKKWFVTVLMCMFTCSLSAQKDFTKYIDPTIGNVSKFLVPTYPTIHLPNQMMRMFPIKKDYISDQIDALPLFVHSHRRAGLFRMTATLGKITSTSWSKKMNIDHDLEVVKPWLYTTYLVDDDIDIHFVPASKAAAYQINFPVSTLQKNILIKGVNNVKILKNEHAYTFQEKIRYKTKGINPVTREMDVYVYATVLDENGYPIPSLKTTVQQNKLAISFAEKNQLKVQIKYAISYISYKQAKENFKKEVQGASLQALKIAGKNSWKKVINQIQVKGGTVSQKRTFYTSLYRTYERMIDINEYGKYYSGYDQQVHASKRPFYVDDWVWDTYRAQHPLRTILAPTQENDMLNSYTLMYEQSGWLPTFPQVHGNHMCMNVYHSAAIFADGHRKGLKKYDVEKAYEGIKKNLTQGTFIPWRQGLPKLAIDDFFHQKGYFPSLALGEKETISMMDTFEKRQPVPVTLGASYDFWTLAQFAKDLGKSKDYKTFSKKGQFYKNLWHPKHRLFMPKDSKGNWVAIDPKFDGGGGFREYFDENNGWTYAWDVQHDIKGLTYLLGGKSKAEQRLDQLFREPLGRSRSQFFTRGSNATGLVGQFSMGNEPSFHIPYLYNYFGAPWKTQKRTRFLLDVWFKDDIHGIPGDEDGGGMTAFVVFTSLGLYPVTPGLPFYDITSPVFEKSTIKLENGQKFTIIAKGASKTKKYIQQAFLNGKEINTPFITHQQIVSGGTLKLILAEKPNKDWGKNAKTPFGNKGL